MLITAGSLFSDAAERFADRPALEDGTSYLELDRVVGRVAGGLAALGLGAGARVGVLSHNRPELIAAWLGLERAGLVRVVLHSHLEIGAHVEMLRRTGATALVFDVRFAELVESELDRLPDLRVLVGVGEGCPEWAMPYESLLAHGAPGFDPVEVEVEEDASSRQAGRRGRRSRGSSRTATG